MPNIDYDGYPNSFTYEGWQMITAKDSQQYKLKDDAGMNFDSEGFGKIGDRYVIACTEHFGAIGDGIDFVLHNGNTLPCVIGDFKSSGDSNYSEYGHILDGSLNVIEFIVDYDTWYNPMHANPGTSSCHPEWAGQLQSYEKAGNYWTGMTTPANNAYCQLILVEGERYFPSRKVKSLTKDTWEWVKVKYIANFQKEEYIYFNDEIFWRCKLDGTYLQSLYPDKRIWMESSLIRNLKVTTVNVSSSFGNGAISPNANVEAAVQWAINKIKEGVTYGRLQNWKDPNVNVYDCSSFVITAFYVGGFDTGNASVTGNMRSNFEAAGFEWIPMSYIPANACQRGDILLNEVSGPSQGHTQLYIGNNQDANAGQSPAVIQTHSPTFIDANGVDWGWDGILRYAGTEFGGGSGGTF